MAEGGAFFGPILAIDTCGPTGSVALGRLAGRDLDLLGQKELEGRTYSATLVTAVAELLDRNQIVLNDLGGIVVVNGPGSFTGVRVGLSAVKGLAEPTQIPVVAISRLLVLSRKSGVPSCALDAHRGEIFLRTEEPGSAPRELLAGARELASIDRVPLRVAVCDEAAAALLGSEERLEYTLVGDTVNMSQRLQQLAAAGETVLSEGTLTALRDPVTTVPLPAQLVKGRDTPVVAFRLVDEADPSTVLAPSERL